MFSRKRPPDFFFIFPFHRPSVISGQILLLFWNSITLASIGTYKCLVYLTLLSSYNASFIPCIPLAERGIYICNSIDDSLFISQNASFPGVYLFMGEEIYIILFFLILFETTVIQQVFSASLYLQGPSRESWQAGFKNVSPHSTLRAFWYSSLACQRSALAFPLDVSQTYHPLIDPL